MRPKMILSSLLLASAIAVAGAPAVFAANDKGEAAEMQALAGAKIAAVEAAQAVLAQFGGTVSSVQIMELDHRPVFHVEVVHGDKQSDYAVDGLTGDVKQMAAQAEGGDDDNDEGDEGDED